MNFFPDWFLAVSEFILSYTARKAPVSFEAGALFTMA